jgi:ketosteroid isomerase-like protein
MSDTKDSIKAAVKAARAESNAAIAAHDDFKVSALVDRDVVVVIGAESVISERKNLRAEFASQFRRSADLLYVRTPDKIDVSEDLAEVTEHGHWTGSWSAEGKKISSEGSYMAVWHKVADKWLTKAEMYGNLK